MHVWLCFQKNHNSHDSTMLLLFLLLFVCSEPHLKLNRHLGEARWGGTSLNLSQQCYQTAGCWNASFILVKVTFVSDVPVGTTQPRKGFYVWVVVDLVFHGRIIPQIKILFVEIINGVLDTAGCLLV
ncbi:hypothetical protein ILYODFUR_004329 [Ilyodon furcidens]|uniref:Secreted protein n=1 Tax=Ilyodon furcidens TaxID=33524 RepID=A0ABV0SLN3_9TELE